MEHQNLPDKYPINFFLKIAKNAKNYPKEFLLKWLTKFALQPNKVFHWSISNLIYKQAGYLP